MTYSWLAKVPQHVPTLCPGSILMADPVACRIRAIASPFFPIKPPFLSCKCSISLSLTENGGYPKNVLFMN